MAHENVLDAKRPPPAGRHNVDQMSVGTASIDWQAPHSDSDDGNVAAADIPTSAMMLNAQGKGEKARMTKEGEKEEKLYATHKERLSRVIYVSMMGLLVLFLVNAAFVSLALWRVAATSPEDVAIERVEVLDLDRPTARLNVKAQLPDRWYYQFFNVVVHEPTTVKIYVPEAIRSAKDKWHPVVTVKLPRIDVGRNSRGVDWKDVPLTLSNEVPLGDLIDYMRAGKPKRLEVRVSFEVETTSYWVPIRFRHSIQKSIVVPVQKGPVEMPALEAVEFLDSDSNGGGEKKDFNVRIHIRYPKQMLPDYLSIQLPELFVDVAYLKQAEGAETTDLEKALGTSSIAQVAIERHLVRRGAAKDVGDESMAVRITVDGKRKGPMVSLLERARDGDFDWSLAVGAVDSDERAYSHLQGWLRSFAYEMRFVDLVAMFSAELGEKLLRKREERDGGRASIDVGLVEIDDRGRTPKFVGKVSLRHEYVEELLLGTSVKLDGLIRGSLPKITLQALVDKGDLAQGPTAVSVIDLVHTAEQQLGTLQTDFFVYVELVDVSALVKASHKLGRIKHTDAIAEELDEYKAILVRVLGDTVLDEMLRVFEVQWGLHQGVLSFVHGDKPRIIKMPSTMSAAPSEPSRPVKHSVSLDIATDKEIVTSTGKIRLAKHPAQHKPYLYLYWEAMDVSVYPADSRRLGHVELVHLKVKKGHARMLIAPLSPLQLLYHGAFEFVLAVRDAETVIRGEPALMAAWKHMARLYTTPVFPPIQVVGRIGHRKLNFVTCLPPSSTFFKEGTDWPLWVTDVIRTRVKLAGFKQATLQVLLELPRLGSCTMSERRSYSSAVNLTVNLPAVHVNGCLYPRKASGKEEIACVAQIGLHPIVLDVALVDGEFCDITTRLVDPAEDGRNSQHRREAAGNNDGDEALINLLPMSAAVTDLRGAFEAFDKLADRQIRTIKASLGYSDRRQMMTKETTLLDRVLNGVGQVLPLELPIYSKTKRPRMRPPVVDLYRKEPLSCKVEIDSASPTTLNGKVILGLPSSILPLAGKSRHLRRSLAFLLSVQWGRTVAVVRHARSWLKLRISQGQATFRLDEDRVLLGRHHGIPTTPQVTIEFAARMQDEHSSATMRRVLAHLHNFVKRRAGDPASRRVMHGLAGKNLDFEIHTRPFVEQHDRAKLIRPAAPLGRPDQVFKHQLPVKTLVEFWMLAWKRFQGSKSGKGGKRGGKKDSSLSDYSLVIKPKPYPGLRKLHLPCVIPNMCDSKELGRSLPSGKFLYAHVSLFNVVQPIADMIGFALGRLLDRINLRQHPEFVKVKIQVSRLLFALAVNDVDAISIGVEPLEFTRIARLAYPERETRRARRQEDVEVVVADLRLPKGAGQLGDLLSPWRFDPTFNLAIDKVPKYKRRGRRVPVHFEPLNISFSTEHLRGKTTLLSTLLAMSFPETNVGPIFSALGKGPGMPMNLVKTTKDEMHMVIRGINIKNPISFASIVMDEPISYRYIFKGLEFVRVKIGRVKLVPGDNRLMIYAIVSRTAFGKLKTAPGVHFVPQFSEFLTGLALGDAIALTAQLDLTPKFRLSMDLSFARRPASMGTFNTEISGVEWQDVHELTVAGSKLPRAGWRAAKDIVRRTQHDLGRAWQWGKSWVEPAVNWAWNGLFGGRGSGASRKKSRASRAKQRGASGDKQRYTGYDKQRDTDYDKQRDTDYDKRKDTGYDKRRDTGYDKRKDTDYERQKHLAKRSDTNSEREDPSDDQHQEHLAIREDTQGGMNGERQKHLFKRGDVSDEDIIPTRRRASRRRQDARPAPQRAMTGTLQLSEWGKCLWEGVNKAYAALWGDGQPAPQCRARQRRRRSTESSSSEDQPRRRRSSRRMRRESRRSETATSESRSASDAGSSSSDSDSRRHRTRSASTEPAALPKAGTAKPPNAAPLADVGPRTSVKPVETLDNTSGSFDSTEEYRQKQKGEGDVKKSNRGEWVTVGDTKPTNGADAGDKWVTVDDAKSASSAKAGNPHTTIEGSRPTSSTKVNNPPTTVTGGNGVNASDGWVFPDRQIGRQGTAKRDEWMVAEGKPWAKGTLTSGSLAEGKSKGEAVDQSRSRHKTMTRDEFVDTLVLGSIPKGSELEQRERKKLQKSRNYFNSSSSSVDSDEPNKDRPTPRKWESRICRADEAERRFLKRKDREGHHHHHSKRVSSKEFDRMWGEERKKDANPNPWGEWRLEPGHMDAYRVADGKKGRKKKATAEGNEKDEEEQNRDSDRDRDRDRGREGKSKRHAKRAVSSSESTSESETVASATLSSTLSKRQVALSSTPSKRQAAILSTSSKHHRKEKVKSWSEIIATVKSMGQASLAKVLANHEKIYYHMGYRNEANFGLMIIGLSMQLEFRELQGRLYSTTFKALQSLTGHLRGEAYGKLVLAPPPCRDDLGEVEFLRCVHANVDKSPVDLPPNYVMTRAETVKGTVTVPNLPAVPQILDQMLYRDGLCIAVRPSLVTVGLKVPNAPKMKPFVMDLLIQLDDIAQENTPFSDACHKSVACWPSPATVLHVKRALLKKQVLQQPKEAQISTTEPQKGVEHNAVTRLWAGTRLATHMNMELRFKFRFTHLNKAWATRRFGPEQPGWALVFQAGKRPALEGRTDYGYVGMRRSVALVCDPVKGRLAVFKDGESTPIMAKDMSSFPADFLEGGWMTVIVQYHPHLQRLAVAIARETKPKEQYLSVFPADVPALLGRKHMHVGFTLATGQFAVPAVADLEVRAPIPDLTKTRIYYVDTYSILPHQKGTFLLELRDSCGSVMPLSPVGVKVLLWRVRSPQGGEDSDGGDDSIDAHPAAYAVRCKTRPVPESGVQEVIYRPTLPGRYRIYVAYDQRPKEIQEGGDDLDPIKWVRIRQYHIYVRNLW